MSDLDTFNHMTQFYTDEEIAQGKDVKQRLLDVLETCKTQYGPAVTKWGLIFAELEWTAAQIRASKRDAETN